ncbi:exopolysaccharide inner membrane protein [Phlyctema vagabunda]|uniref:Exopolysaccharide inner membrane protein n=1 Tax=Phlyctema vagabunda TaxID=108571 RepID=A0ABR4PT96_9HELO
MLAKFTITFSSVAFIAVEAAFIHPGMLHTTTDFNRMRAKVNANASPWITSWDLLTANSHASSAYTARPQSVVYRGSDGVHAENYAILFNDVAAAYALALRYQISGDTQYATAAVNIFNAWATTLTALGGSADHQLLAGLQGYQFANAAEMMRQYSGWESADQTKFKTMMVDIFYSVNHDFLVRHNDAAIDHYWANWDLCNMASIIAIGILTDNTTMYNEGIDYFRSGAGNGAIDHAIWKLYTDSGEALGQGQEAGRDQGHSNLDYAILGPIAQMSYNQGLDLWAYQSNKILAGSEYNAKYNLGNTVPYTTYTNSDVTQTVISNNSRGDIRPMWEMIYGYYNGVKGLEAPYVAQYRDLVNSELGGAEGGGGNYGSTSGGYDQLGYGTLTFRIT